ncbi:hypothetical protein GBAR_LOCUS21296 [Geodia barretti]|uniref:Uncharacterized protein n=1 Tax=Geodia barretti TaxID=519541 RepID=A0AA35SYU4_GEOBA|nr:hypothetical protein GBAR_LOCUS21296 [Geodia barretti]
MFLHLAVFLPFLLVGARSSVCLPYWWVDPQCVTAHPLCSSVELYGNLTLEESESLLRTLFSDANSAVENGEFTPPCGGSFHSSTATRLHEVQQYCSNKQLRGRCSISV